VATLVELSHRVTSGLALVFTVGLLAAALLTYPREHVVRKGAAVSTALMFGEALIGAGLVLFRLVAHDESIARAFSVCLHLCNTFLLLASTAMTAWWASGGAPLRLRGQRAIAWTMGLPLAGLMLVGASGAVTALGDTLFPPASLAAGLVQDLAPRAHLFIRLRALHPLLAMTVGAGVVVANGVVRTLRPSRAVVRLSVASSVLVAVQLCAGLLNVLTLAPVWLQLVHLLLADLVWITTVLTATAALAVSAPDAQATPLAATTGTRVATAGSSTAGTPGGS
jgi:heme A synthase